jgi:hypothetical protein
MKSWLKWLLGALLAAVMGVSIHMAQTQLMHPASPPQLVSVRADLKADRVMVTYFSNDQRCTTCVRIERMTRQVVERRFKSELRSGELSFRVVNLDRPGNEHYSRDYALLTKSVIVSDHAQAEQVRWENLQQVWLKQRDAQAFERYVVDAVRRHLDSLS